MEKVKNLLQLQKESDSKPFPVLLGPLKRFLQQEAQDKKKPSLHWHLKNILGMHVERSKNEECICGSGKKYGECCAAN